MAMALQRIGLHAFIEFRVQIDRFHLPAGAGNAAFGVDDDRAFAEKSPCDQRQAGQDRRRRVAARVGDQPRFLDLVAIALRQAVDGFLHQRRAPCFPYHFR